MGPAVARAQFCCPCPCLCGAVGIGGRSGEVLELRHRRVTITVCYRVDSQYLQFGRKVVRSASDRVEGKGHVLAMP